MKSKYEVTIIGGGSGGYVAAIRLNQLGIDTVLFEQEKLGGVCLNYGCIPTKALIANATLYREMQNSEKFGISCESPKVNWEIVQNRKTDVVEKLVRGVEYIFSKRGIDICYNKVHKITQGATFHKVHYIDVDGSEASVDARFIIIATGSKPKPLPNMNFDHQFILNSKDLLAIKEIPQKLVVIGGGMIGCEFATIFNSLGTDVEIIEFMPTLIPNEDKEIAKKLGLELKKRKIRLHLGTMVEDYRMENNKVILSLSNKKVIETDKVLISIGRTPRFDIEVDGDKKISKPQDKSVTVNQYFETKIQNIFAIGDVIAKQMLAHTASKQGVIVASHIKNLIEKKVITQTPLNYANIPRCIFTEPEIGCVGLTESEAREKYNSVSVGKFIFRANGKALAIGKESGFVKVILDNESQKILGLHIIGPSATELVAEGAVLINSEVLFDEIEKTVFAHPTLSEVVHEAILDTQGFAIHKI